MAGAVVNGVPLGWPGNEVNIESWSMRRNYRGRLREQPFHRVRVTHRETGTRTLGWSTSPRHAMAVALDKNRRLVAAYKLLGLA